MAAWWQQTKDYNATLTQYMDPKDKFYWWFKKPVMQGKTVIMAGLVDYENLVGRPESEKYLVVLHNSDELPEGYVAIEEKVVASGKQVAIYNGPADCICYGGDYIYHIDILPDGNYVQGKSPFDFYNDGEIGLFMNNEAGFVDKQKLFGDIISYYNRDYDMRENWRKMMEAASLNKN